MSAHPWYKRYGADFVHGTLGLSLEEKGAYSLCLDLMYDRGASIPDDARWLAGVCNVSVRKWNAIRERLLSTGKLKVDANGRLTNARAEKEMLSAGKNSRKLAESGRKGGNKRAENAGERRKINGLDQASLNHTRAFQIPDREEEPTGSSIADATASLSETSSDAPPKSRKKRTAYSPDFEAFWRGYPTDALMSKAKAFDAWRRLDSDARSEVMTSLPAFRAYCSSKPDYRPVHAVRYITQHRSEGFVELASKAADRVFVAKDTPEWEAWQRVKKVQPVMSTEHHKEGWWFPSRFPQQQEAAA